LIVGYRPLCITDDTRDTSKLSVQASKPLHQEQEPEKHNYLLQQPGKLQTLSALRKFSSSSSNLLGQSQKLPKTVLLSPCC